MKKLGLVPLLAAVVLCGTVWMRAAPEPQRLPSVLTPPSVAPAPPQIPAGNAADYVGAERCQSCHKAEFTQFHKTPHAALTTPAGAVTQCEVCHGPGRAHSEGEEAAHGDDALAAKAASLVFGFDGTPEENAARCLTCHSSSKNQSNFAHSEHVMHGVACNSCHATHLVDRTAPTDARLASTQGRLFAVPEPRAEQAWLRDGLLQKPQPALCATCHSDVVAKFALPVHHRVPEGLMKCTDCHQPHGTENPTKLKTAGWEACVSCHVEKRGPVVFEHAAVQVGGCVACHTPHGSVNRQLLERREGRFLCLQCHVDPSAPNTPHSHLGYQASGECTRCHVAIHGSNFNEFFLH